MVAEIDGPRLTAIIEFLQQAEKLKDTLRSGRTSGGRAESTAEHTWRLCLLALLLRKEFPGIDHDRLLKLLVLHDLGEAISGDVPAIHQSSHDGRKEREQRDFEKLTEILPIDLRLEMRQLWNEYSEVSSPEAQVAKGLDKIETMLQHLTGANDPDFDWAFNLNYGAQDTGRHPVLRALREEVDRETRRRAVAAGQLE